MFHLFNSHIFLVTESSVARRCYRKVTEQNNSIYLKVTGPCEMVSGQPEWLLPLKLTRQGLFPYLVPIECLYFFFQVVWTYLSPCLLAHLCLSQKCDLTRIEEGEPGEDRA